MPVEAFWNSDVQEINRSKIWPKSSTVQYLGFSAYSYIQTLVVIVPSQENMHAKVRQCAISEIFGHFRLENELMQQIWQLSQNHWFMKKFQSECAFVNFMRWNSFFEAFQILHFWKLPKMRLDLVFVFNGEGVVISKVLDHDFISKIYILKL